jgi:signal transduction histidine kinase
VLLLLLCAALSAVAGLFFLRSIGRPDTGFVGYYPEVQATGGQVLFSPTAPFSPAMASGLIPLKDRILSINGMQVGNSRDVLRAAASVERFSPFPVIISRDGGLPRIVEVTPAFLPAQPQWIFVLLFCAVLAATALLLAIRLPGEPSTLPLLLCALLSLLFTCVKPLAYESVPANLLFNAGNAGSWLLVVFALYFPRPRGPRALRVLFVTALGVLSAVFCAVRVILYARWTATGLEQALGQYKLAGQAGNVSDGVAYVVLVVLLATAWKHARLPRERRMLQWLLAGALVALPPYFFFDQLPLILGGPSAQVGLGPLAQFFLSLLPVFLLIGLARKSLFDFSFFLARYALYGGLLLLMICLFMVVYLPLKGFLESGYRMAAPLPELFTAAIIVFAIAALRGGVELLLSRRFRGKGGVRPEGGAAAAGQRELIQGLVRALQGPVRKMALAIARGGAADAQEAATTATGVLQALAAGAAAHPAIHGSFLPGDLARGAIERAKSRFTGTRFVLEGQGRERVACCLEEVVEALAAVLANAAEAQEGAQEPVKVRVAEEGDRVHIEVSDSGQGMEPRVTRRLFEPFFTTRPGRQGLGLYFARMNVESNDGTLQVRPGESGGTTVRLSFPRAAEGLHQKEKQ